MKKLIVLFILIMVFVTVIITINSISNEELSMSSDGLQINISYLDGSTELVSDVSIEGNLLKQKTLSYKAHFQEENTLVIENNSSSEIEVIVSDLNGTELFTKKIYRNEEQAFNSLSEQGSIELILESGDHNIFFSINGRN